MTSDEINLADVLAEVRAVFDAYEAALRRNDAAALDDFFWDDPQTLRYGIAERNVGIAGIRRWRATAPAISPTRRLHDTRITTFGRDIASVCTEFLVDETTALGRQTQLWVRFDLGWRIVAAHVSLMRAGIEENER